MSETFQQFVQKLVTPYAKYFQTLQEVFHEQPYSAIRIAYRLEFDEILTKLKSKGFGRKTATTLWEDLLMCQAMAGWSQRVGQRCPHPPTPPCLRHMKWDLKKQLADHIIPLYFKQSLSVNRLPYTHQFEALYQEGQRFLRFALKEGLTKEAFFLFLKNLGRAKRGHEGRLGKRTPDRQAYFRGEGFGL